jgi:tRNA A37 methylthiotransferase MiaB
MRFSLCTSPHLNHASFQEGVVPLGGPAANVAQTFAPMGLLSLAAAAENVGEVQIADVNKAINIGRLSLSEAFYDEAAAWLLQSDPHLVGFMTEADSYHHVLRVCHAIKSLEPGVATLLGGPHASAVAEETLQAFPAVDFVIRGEGEVALPQLVHAFSGCRWGDIGNLTYRDDGVVVSTPSLPLILDLDTLPWPDFGRIALEPDDGLFVEIGRGCPFKCNFCFTAPYWSRKHRIKSPARIIRELAYLQQHYGRNDFNFTHDLFTTQRKWVLGFCRELIESGLEITWTCSSRTDTLDQEQIEWMARAGCRNIYFGVETGTAEMQASIDKNLDLAEAERIIGSTVDAGIGVTVGFIAGLPGESDASLRGTLEMGFKFLALPDSLVHLFGYSPYRGSSNYDRIRDQLTFDPHFVDFPLGRRTHEQNCRIMAGHLPIFSRYSWPRYAGLNPEVVRAAEEFFPLVNALRNVLLAVNERGIDALQLLLDWTAWIGRENRSRGMRGTGVNRGAIGDLLRFLGEYVIAKRLDDPPLMELLNWEAIKNELRGERALPSGDARPAHGVLCANGTLRMASFRFAPSFRRSAPQGESTRFAFYVRLDGSPGIVRLDRLGELVLSTARMPMPRTELTALVADPRLGAPPEAEAALAGAVAELEQLELLVPAEI